METPAINSLPEGVEQGDLYDGPKPGENVIPLPSQGSGWSLKPDGTQSPVPTPIREPQSPQPQVTPTKQLKNEYPAVLTAALDILSARLLGLLAVIAACIIWGFAVYDPNTMRTVAAALFSVTVLGPIVALYWKAG